MFLFIYLFIYYFPTIKITQALHYTKMWRGDLRKPQGLYEEAPSYDSVLRILHERYGQPAAVAAACIESLTKGPKLHNNDYTGLLNFAELGRSFIQHSGKGRNPTAVRSFKVCQASGGN